MCVGPVLVAGVPLVLKSSITSECEFMLRQVFETSCVSLSMLCGVQVSQNPPKDGFSYYRMLQMKNHHNRNQKAYWLSRRKQSIFLLSVTRSTDGKGAS